MGERALRGVSAAPGVAVGKAFVLDRSAAHDATVVAPPDRPAELERARQSLSLVATEMEQIASGLREAGRHEEADIIETSAMMAGDPELDASVEKLVMQSGRPAAAAMVDATEEIARQLAQLGDPLLAERADDVRSLGRRAAARATGKQQGMVSGILIAGSLGPADVAEIAANVNGVALAGGGVTAHAAIVARSLGVPMVVGIGAGVLDVEDGEEVVLDGDGGVLVRQPEPSRVAAASAEAERRRLARQKAVGSRLEPAQTKDGHRLRVLANAASVAEVVEALEQGAEGIGLLRTELLFLDSHAWPAQAQQTSFLKLILAPLTGRVATVRLLDFGGDKTPPFLRGAAGRGIELLLEAADALKAQLAAILDSGADVKLRILIPMVTRPEQVTAVRQALSSVLAGRPSPELGAMIETPEAAQGASAIAKVSDFLSIGTNDLTQLVLGLDREHSKTAPVTDVKVMRLIDATVRAAHEAGILVDVCGESASDAVAMPILVGLGVDELSVAAARVGEVRQWIRGLDFAASRTDSERWLLDQPADAAGKRL
ncbi:MAG TPA: putative PEP-binding protein [Verrucomicrobiae bacterium]|jgi:phosphoenolpyruvate-protein phosphotransferase|nr:putative PEP-binding protein [Verrucomicrobiae bacterium]